MDQIRNGAGVRDREWLTAKRAAAKTLTIEPEDRLSTATSESGGLERFKKMIDNWKTKPVVELTEKDVPVDDYWA